MGRGGQRHALADSSPVKSRYTLCKKLGGRQGRSGRLRKILPPTGIRSPDVQPVASRYTSWECENIISRLKGKKAESLAEYLTLFSRRFLCEILSFISSVAENPDFETSSSDYLPEGGNPKYFSGFRLSWFCFVTVCQASRSSSFLRIPCYRIHRTE
jgi:hypothetical protein